MKVVLVLILLVLSFSKPARAITFVLQQNTTSELCYFYSPVVRNELNEVLKNFGLTNLNYTFSTNMIAKDCVLSLQSTSSEFDFEVSHLSTRRGTEQTVQCKADVKRLTEREGTFWADAHSQKRGCSAMSASVFRK